jgi:hypothetical protein
MPDIRKILEESGFKVEGLDRIRLARGVVGKSSYVAGAAMLVFAVLAMRVSGVGLFAALIGATVVLFICYLIGILWFATKNPGLALLEGAELIQWRQMDMGVKGTPTLPNEANTSAPLQIEGPDKA